MQDTLFHAYKMARRLEGFANNEALLPAFTSTSIGIYPYQIAAARFAMRSHYEQFAYYMEIANRMNEMPFKGENTIYENYNPRPCTG